jgi:excisionase family DNA binding protein
MTTNSTLIQNITPDELRQIVREELLSIQPKESFPNYLTRDEVCSLLKISLPTLNSYTRKGIVKGVKVGSRVLYSEENIKSALQDATQLKYRRG